MLFEFTLATPTPITVVDVATGVSYTLTPVVPIELAILFLNAFAIFYFYLS
jgi:hypothetical protein